ncbi:Cof-type HAD-IIB family hydrolase [Synechocystis sp. LKSZ1]|uniref:Cof-type HAD-IIB family hydrolase n=1 Tax=Synechocystis sp. LKSZ1 TaxID=3144951 RepID=UPI00336BD8B7
MAIKLLVLDIDGTIAGESNHIRPKVKDAIRKVQAKGIAVTLATGRMYHSALPFHQAIASTFPLIAYNGAWTKAPQQDQLLREFALPTTLALEILDYFEQAGLRQKLEVHCYHQDQLYVREITPETERYVARSGVQPHAVGDLRPIIEKSTIKLLAISPQVGLIQALITDLHQRYATHDVHLTQSTEIYFEITHAKANKGLAVQHLAEDYLGLQPEQVMAIGDNFNDLEMLRYAGLSVAMGNAPEPVQAVADWITDDVEADGVALALEKFLLA